MDYHSDHFFSATQFLLLVSFPYFLLVLCARLSWPSRQLLSALKYTISYGIVSYRYVTLAQSLQGKGTALEAN